MFIKITEDGTYLGSSNRSLKGYFPVSHELSKSLRTKVIKNTSNIRRAIGTKPEDVKVSPEELWGDIKEDIYSLVETYVVLYSELNKIDPGVVVFVEELKKELDTNVARIIKIFKTSDKIPSNLFAIALSLANGEKIVDAEYEEKKEPEQQPELPVTEEPVVEDDTTSSEPEPAFEQIQTSGDENASDGKRAKGKRSKGRGGSGSQPGSTGDTN